MLLYGERKRGFVFHAILPRVLTAFLMSFLLGDFLFPTAFFYFRMRKARRLALLWGSFGFSLSLPPCRSALTGPSFGTPVPPSVGHGRGSGRLSGTERSRKTLTRVRAAAPRFFIALGSSPLAQNKRAGEKTTLRQLICDHTQSAKPLKVGSLGTRRCRRLEELTDRMSLLRIA